jgi:hypothetical protein
MLARNCLGEDSEILTKIAIMRASEYFGKQIEVDALIIAILVSISLSSPRQFLASMTEVTLIVTTMLVTIRVTSVMLARNCLGEDSEILTKIAIMRASEFQA